MALVEYQYWAFGLTIRSAICFPELLPSDSSGCADVSIQIGTVGKMQHTQVGFWGEQIQIDVSSFYLEMPGVASYQVTAGNTIVVQPEVGGDWDSIRLFCLSNAFAALLQQRRLIPLHCSALLAEDELLLIFGHSGAGKSTLFAGLQERGLKAFSDDVCVPAIDEQGNISMFSSYPMMKFWASTLELLGWQERVTRRVRPGFDKFGVYFHESFEVDAKKPGKIIILEKSDVIVHPDIRELKGIALFKQLEVHAYRSEFLPYTGLKSEHFRLFTHLANQTRTFLLRRPVQGDSLDEMLDLVQAI